MKKWSSGALHGFPSRFINISSYSFVCAVPAGHMAHPTLFRSWAASKNPTFDCTIVEAVRATSADPTLFKGIDIGQQNLKVRYLDGGLRCNNPVRYVLQ